MAFLALFLLILSFYRFHRFFNVLHWDLMYLHALFGMPIFLAKYSKRLSRRRKGNEGGIWLALFEDFCKNFEGGGVEGCFVLKGNFLLIVDGGGGRFRSRSESNFCPD